MSGPPPTCGSGWRPSSPGMTRRAAPRVAAPFGLPYRVRASVVLLPHGNDDEWRDVAARLAAIPRCSPAGGRAWRPGWPSGPAGRPQAGAGLADAGRASSPARATPTGARRLRRHLRRGPGQGRAGQVGGGGPRRLRRGRPLPARGVRAPGERGRRGRPERYAVLARISLGADIDLREAYEWGWAELEPHRGRDWPPRSERITAGRHHRGGDRDPQRHPVRRRRRGAYQGWLQERHDRAIEQLHGTHFDIPVPLHSSWQRSTVSPTVLRCGLLQRAQRGPVPPGPHLWPVGGRTRFATWSELTTIFHEAVPGHHLQFGAMRMAGDSLSRFAKVSWVTGTARAGACTPSGWPTSWAGSPIRAPGWACSTGRPCAPPGWSSTWASTSTCRCPTARSGPSRRPARCCATRAVASRTGSRPRSCATSAGRPRPSPTSSANGPGWAREGPGRAWAPDFDLSAWHTAALELGPVGLSSLAEALRRIG